ncbi:hypothetical protein B7P43_G04578, partial [Cryptotermes secundus]
GQPLSPVTELCLGCLCEANTDCNRSFRCEEGECGLFRISVPYWKDAGSPIIKGDNDTTDGAFERCVLDPYCAASTVQGYMARFRKDCNGDNKVDCQDFALLHYLGAGCEGAPGEDYKQFRDTLNECLAEVTQLATSST